MEHIDCIVIGAGVVGLAIARALANAGREVLILEQEASFGTGISSRSSEVIHAGIYYPRPSLMARFCVAGRQALYAYAHTRGVPFRRCGKLIVATTAEEVERLYGIERHARANGVEDLVFLTQAQAQDLEPSLACKAALLSPSTGIVDSHALMMALLSDAEDGGAVLALRSSFSSAIAAREGFHVEVNASTPQAISLSCMYLINAAGLEAPNVAKRVSGLDPCRIPTAYYAKGNYFTIGSVVPFTRLIYPVPVAGGLGVHLTLDLGGQARFGPDVEWVEAIDYHVNPERVPSFYQAIRRYWPALKDGALEPAYAGIRPKIVPPAIAKQDFVIEGAERHGVRGLINLFGIESPGLTASLAIAEHVRELAEKM